MNNLWLLVVIWCAVCVPQTSLGQKGTSSRARVLTEVNHEERVRLNGGKDFIIEVIQDTNHLSEIFSEDWLLFIIKDTSGKVLRKEAFHSTYQQFRVEAVDLDGDGNDEFVFTTGEGRGMSVRKEFLNIERVENGKLRIILSLPLSDYYEEGKMWWYSVSYQRDEKSHATNIELKLDADDPSGLEYAPHERSIFNYMA